MGWVRPDPTIWAGPSKVGWVNYDLLDLSSLFFFFFIFTLGGLDSVQPSGLGWKGSSPTHVSGIFPFTCKKSSICKWLWRSFGEEKWEEDLPGRRRKEAGGVPGGTGKTDVWFGWWRQWRQRCGGYSGAKKASKGGEKKTGEMLFFPTLASDFLMLNVSNSPLFIRGGKGTPFLYWCQILVFELTRKDPNCWFKIAVKALKSWQLKAGRVGHFGVVLWWL